MDMPKHLNGEKVTVKSSGAEAVIHHATCEDGVTWKYFIALGGGEFIGLSEEELEAG